jgi:hypothetical protein
MFGMPTEDDGSRTDPLLGQNMITNSHYEPDFDALRSASTQVVVAAGEESEGQMASRRPSPSTSGLAPSRCSTRAITAASSATNTARPASPDAFAAKLREVLAASA